MNDRRPPILPRPELLSERGQELLNEYRHHDSELRRVRQCVQELQASRRVAVDADDALAVEARRAGDADPGQPHLRAYQENLAAAEREARIAQLLLDQAWDALVSHLKVQRAEEVDRAEQEVEASAEEYQAVVEVSRIARIPHLRRWEFPTLWAAGEGRA